MVVPEDREQFLLGAIHASELLELKDAENPLMHLCELPDGDPRQERIRSAAERALQAIKT